jgi:cysteine desulfurase/selenocysteine lyase
LLAVNSKVAIFLSLCQNNFLKLKSRFNRLIKPRILMNEQIRQLFPIRHEWVYLNHASCSPPPATAIAAMNRQLRDVQTNGSLNYKNWVAAKENCRRLTAGLLNARPEQIAFLRNTSDCLSCVANGLRWSAGENIVTFQNEFPSNIYPWRRIRDVYGVELRFCPERDGRIDLDEFCSLIDEKTRVVTISAVQYASGFRADLRKIADAAHKFDALFVVDVIQAMGANPLDVEKDNFDAAAGGFHKWLLAPEGTAFLYLSDRARSRVEPTLVGWISVAHHENFNDFEQEYKRGTLAWESGTFASSIFYAVEECLKIFHRYGVEKINSYLLELTDFLCENVNAENYKVVGSRLQNEKSPLVCLQNKKGLSAWKVTKQLQKEKIIVVPRGDRIRISPHIYNTLEDMKKLIAALP